MPKKKQDIKSVKLGTKIRDKVTGFEGIAIAKTEFLNGCVQFHLKAPMDKDGKVKPAESFDCQQLELVDNGFAKKKKKGEKPKGGIMPDTPIIN